MLLLLVAVTIGCSADELHSQHLLTRGALELHHPCLKVDPANPRARSRRFLGHNRAWLESRQSRSSLPHLQEIVYGGHAPQIAVNSNTTTDPLGSGQWPCTVVRPAQDTVPSP